MLKTTDKDTIKQRLSTILGSFDNFTETHINETTRNNIIQWADETLSHKFDYLGSGLTKLDPIDWHVDFKSGYRWPKGKFYKAYKKVDLSNSADVKVPWELSRCHHLLWLGEAYLLTKNEKYAKEVVFQIEHWINENPLMYSINWTCAMEVAIRAINWMYGVNMVIQSACITDDFCKKLTNSLFEHGFFIFNNLEKGFPYSANHYASNIAGLLFIGQYFKGTKPGKKWWSFSKIEYFSEVRQQVLPSGVHFEKSVSYHRLITELFLYPYLLLLRIHERIPIDIHERIRQMISFIVFYTKPNGLSPMIGDSDNGRVLPFEKNNFNDHRYLPGIYSKLCTDIIFQKFSDAGQVDSFFMMTGLKNQNQNITQLPLEKLLSKPFRDAGFIILRTNDVQLFFNNSGLSRHQDNLKKIYGTHTHSDLLSFEFSVGELDIFIDPGTYVYTASSKNRNDFRSTQKHNTMVFDNLNQYELVQNNLFSFSGKVNPQPVDLYLSEDYEECEGSYYKIISQSRSINHKRRIQLSKNLNHLIIHDSVNYEGKHELSLFFHLAPGIKAIKKLDHILVLSHKNFLSSIVFPNKEGAKIEILDDNISPSYGIIENSKTIKYSCPFYSSIEFETKIEWKLK